MSETSNHDGKTRTIPEYALRLRVSTSKIREWLADGSIVGTDVAGRSSSKRQVIFTAEQQIAFERSRETHPQKSGTKRSPRRSKRARRFPAGEVGDHIEI